MQHYGHKRNEDEGYPLAAWIWGHRLRSGQHWMEYLLEFLNVLAGFEYQLGHGLDGSSYQRFTRLGLRRFVFYDTHEKTTHSYDDLARDLLWQKLREDTFVNYSSRGDEPLTLTKNLLKAFSAIEDSRSWYAKSLFPAHENLLFWEALRKGATKYRSKQVSQDTRPFDLDKDISFSDRNFFARGGELYYLILSAGTEEAPSCRSFIASRLKNLLQQNSSLGELARAIDQAWQKLLETEAIDHSPNHQGTLGWIPNSKCSLYQVIAEDIATFLESNLDPLESLDLLAHLISFHLVQYIYHFSHPELSINHTNSSCLNQCRPHLLVDSLDGKGKEGEILRKESAKLFREQEYRQEQRATTYIQSQLKQWIENIQHTNNSVEELGELAKKHFNLDQATKKTRQEYDNKIQHLSNLCSQKQFNNMQIIEELTDILTSFLLGDFRKNFLPVHRKLAKRSGFVAPQVGTSARFVFGDNLLKAIVLATVSPGSQVPFGDFLKQLFTRYGIIVGPEEARESGLFNRQRINVEYYDFNRTALLEKMKHAGLVIEYSDATALVVNNEVSVVEAAANV